MTNAKPPIRRWSQVSCLLLALVALQASRPDEKVQRAESEYPGKQWSQAGKPEDRGWSSDKLAAAKSYADSISTAAVVIVDDGTIVSRWGETTTKFNVHS